MNRRIPALIGAAALLTATLAGCTGASGLGGCDPRFDSGDASDIVTGSAQSADFPTPLVTTKTQVSVVQAGDGPLVQSGQQVDFSQAIYYGKDGSAISSPAASRTETGLVDDTVSEAMVCAHVGDTIAVVSTVEAAFGKGAGGTQYADSDTLVIVLDITGAYLGKANGFNLLPQDGMPVVVTAVDGTPAIALDFVSKPAHTRVETVKAGDGSALATGDSAVLHARAWTWPDTETDDPTEIVVASQNGSQQPFNTWASHQALTYPVGDSTSSLFPPGVAKALVGAKVGSQLLVVVPPGDGQYATIPSSFPGLTTDQTTIWVIDVLGVQKKS